MLQRDFLRAKRTGSATPTLPPATKPRCSSARPYSSTPLTPLSQNQINQRLSGSLGKVSNNGPPSSASSGRPSRSISASFQPSPTGTGASDERVHVAVRCRPPNPGQGERSDDVIVSIDPSSREIFLLDQESTPWRVETPMWSSWGAARDGTSPVSQSAVYEMLGRPLLTHALDGYNSTLMAYGQTGSGKTYTMMGTGRDHEEEDQAGIVPRMCRELFREINNRSFTANTGETLSWEVAVRYVEVYCEKISDLLNSGASVSLREEVTPQAATFTLVGARRVQVENTEDLMQALSVGNRWRRTAATKSNERSSRSHAIFIIELTEIISFTEPDGAVVSAPSKSLSLRLVDLAGSERVGDTGVQGQLLKEAKDINLSLFTLGCVIECLSDPKRRGIKPPYRDSILTKMLRDAFGGNSKTTMICTISPCEAYRNQTIQTLNYASKAGHVVNRPRIKEDPSAVELRRANEELLNLRQQLSDAQRTGLHYESIEAELKSANQRLQKEQQDARRRRSEMERREAELAARLREMEEQREAYESHMMALEMEAEQAKQQQARREAELRKAHEVADAYAKKRLEELEVEREAAERDLREKEEGLLEKQRAIESRMRETETQSRTRIEDLLRHQKDLEAELKERERLASMQENELREKQRRAEDEARLLEKQARSREEEWAVQLRAIEEAAGEREAEVERRTREAQDRLRATETAAREKEEEMRRKWTDAEQQARKLQMEMEARQTELDRRVLDLNRQAQQRENELNDRLHQAEYELRRRERESAQHKEEVESLRQAAAVQNENSRNRERNLEEQQQMHADALRALEEQLKRRERDLNDQFEEVMAMKRDWEQQHMTRQSTMQDDHERAMGEVRQKESSLMQREGELRHQLDALAAQLRTREMELQRKDVEFTAQRNGFEIQAQRDRHALLRAKEEAQQLKDRLSTDAGMKEGRLREWENDLRTRWDEMERVMKERETALEQKETAVTSAKDATAVKQMELDQMEERLRAEQGELRDAMRVREASQNREHAERMASLERQEVELSDRHRSLESMQKMMGRSTSASTNGSMERPATALAYREVSQLMATESMYRTAVIQECETDLRYLMRHHLLEARDANRREELLRESERLRGVQAEMEAVKGNCQVSESRAMSWKAQVEALQEELEEQRRLVLELRVQVGSSTAAARFAEEELGRVREEAFADGADYRDREEEMYDLVAELRDGAALQDRDYSSLWATAFHLLIEFEEEQRSSLEHHQSHQFMTMRLLDVAERKSLNRDITIDKWMSLYRRASSENEASKSRDAAQQARMVDEADRLRFVETESAKLQLQEQGLIAEHDILEDRILNFESRERARMTELARQEEEVKKYLLELEEMDQAKMRAFDEREAQLIVLEERLRGKQERLRHGMLDNSALLMNGPSDPHAALEQTQDELRRESADRMEMLAKEKALLHRIRQGDMDALDELLELKEHCIKAEKMQLERRMQQAAEMEDERLRRLALYEEEIKQYLLEIEADDIKRNELSEQGQRAMREAEDRLASAKNKEDAMRDLARRLRLEAMEMEEKSRAMETTLRHQEETTREEMRQRREDLERRQRAASTEAEGNERTLIALEDDIKKIVTQNKNAEHEIKNRDAELKRQKKYYLDLSKMLAEREKMLRSEHAHRIDGKKSAAWLAGDLLDVNDQLKRQVKVWRHKFDVLLKDDKIECEKCAWHNKRDATECRCCGDAKLVDIPDLTVAKA